MGLTESSSPPSVLEEDQSANQNRRFQFVSQKKWQTKLDLKNSKILQRRNQDNASVLSSEEQDNLLGYYTEIIKTFNEIPDNNENEFSLSNSNDQYFKQSLH